MKRLNNIGFAIDFTHEQENNTLTWLEFLLINDNKIFEIHVHHKSTNKKDHIHVYSHINTKTKRETVTVCLFVCLFFCFTLEYLTVPSYF